MKPTTHINVKSELNKKNRYFVVVETYIYIYIYTSIKILPGRQQNKKGEKKIRLG